LYRIFLPEGLSAANVFGHSKQAGSVFNLNDNATGSASAKLTENSLNQSVKFKLKRKILGQVILTTNPLSYFLKNLIHFVSKWQTNSTKKNGKRNTLVF